MLPPINLSNGGEKCLHEHRVALAPGEAPDAERDGSRSGHDRLILR
jgi:hypothetical protein